MKRIIGVVAGTLAIALSAAAGAAQAAGPPTVATGHAIDITDTSAVLRAHVNPHGVTTDYTFNYGPTPAYGAASVAHSAGSGDHPVIVAAKIAGLAPGTTYHYQVTGVSAGGSVVGQDASFTTTGVAPSAVATGPATAVKKQAATLTGSVLPGNANTFWQIQYGTTASYGLETAPQSLVASSVASPVSALLSGLAPARLFHYRVVAYHGPIGAASTVPTYGADATFFTQPNNPPSARMTTKTTPGSDSSSPYTFTTTGTLNGGQYIPSAQRCSGSVGIRYYNGKRQLAYVVASVGSDCRFSGKVSFRKTRGSGSVGLRVSIYYRGNGYLHSETKTNHPRAGRGK